MKTFTAVLLFAIIFLCKIEVNAGIGFNLSGNFDPGFTFGNPRKKYQNRNSENDDNGSNWPQPNHINNFEVPESFNDHIPNEPGSNDNKRPQAHNHKSRHRAHRH